MTVRKKIIIDGYSYEKSGRTDGNMFFVISRGDEWKVYTKFYSGSICVDTFSGGYKSTRWIKK